jgi:hypothetical protein
MSNQNGPNWYPSKQFVHSPPPPSGAPSNLGRVPDPDGVQCRSRGICSESMSHA